MNKATVQSTMTELTDEQLKLREQVLAILLKNFSSQKNNTAIYNCAEDWCKKQVTTNGLINYYKAYYGQHGQT